MDENSMGIIILAFLFAPSLLSFTWICLDLYYKYKHGLKHTAYQHAHHFLLYGWILLLVLANTLLPAINIWLTPGIQLAISALICCAISLWDLRAIIERYYDPEWRPLRTKAPGRIAMLTALITGTFGLMALTPGAVWIINMIFNNMIDRHLLSWLPAGVLLLGMIFAVGMYNIWRGEALFKAAQKLRDMPEGLAQETLSAILETANEKRIGKQLFFWQLYNFLIGIWSPALMILLLVLYRLGYISLTYLSLGWIAIGILAIIQTFSRMRNAMATLPPVSKERKMELSQHISSGLMDGICAFSIGILAFIFEVTRPFSLQVLGAIAGGILIFLGVIIYRARKKRGRKQDQKTPRAAKKPPAPAAVEMNSLHIGSIIIAIRRMLGFGSMILLLEFAFDDYTILIMLLYLLAFIAVEGFILFPALNKQFLPEQTSPLEQAPLEQTMSR
jgi:hypothetical protein